MAAVVALWVVVVLLGLLVLGLLRRVNDVLIAVEERLAVSPAGPAEGLPVGARLPEFAVVSEPGEEQSSEDLELGPAVWLLLSAGCPACTRIVEELAGHPDPLHGMRLVVVADDTAEERQRLAGLEATHIYQRDREVAAAFACSATPYGFAVNAAGEVVASGPAGQLDQLRGLAERLEAAAADPSHSSPIHQLTPETGGSRV